ncbi:uncharacterized protein [Vicugna pacos]|uniref:Uncharacterized protein isoform X1 n=1 Tax=Vicugna pacos TaxID=30538 RepID=A0ABM5BU03_VICPA
MLLPQRAEERLIELAEGSLNMLVTEMNELLTRVGRGPGKELKLAENNLAAVWEDSDSNWLNGPPLTASRAVVLKMGLRTSESPSGVLKPKSRGSPYGVSDPSVFRSTIVLDKLPLLVVPYTEKEAAK